MQISLILHNIRSTYNVGAILRSAEGFGVTQVYTSGYTPVYHDPRLLPHLRAKLDRQIAKTALGAEQLVPQQQVSSIEKLLQKLHTDGWTILGLENHLSRPTVTLPQVHSKLGEKVALLLGEEVRGIPEELYSQIDLFTEIPMCGQKESFNVSVAAGIALYELTIK